MLRFCLISCLAVASTVGQTADLAPSQQAPESLLTVRRIYVAPLTGGAGADALRELLISSLNNIRLFVLTEDESRADAVLKGAADDAAFTDTFDSDKSLNDHTNASFYGSGNSSKSKSSGAAGGISVGEREAHHIRERKHEAYAAVRLCSRSGDVLWSTTQESLGGKFRGASADVASKIARQLAADYQATSRPSAR